MSSLAKRTVLEHNLPEKTVISKPVKIEFQKISYDRIFTSNAETYCHQNPGVSMDKALDIMRGKSDQDYLNEIVNECKSVVQESSEFLIKQIIYLDRNNTPDVWPDIRNTIQNSFPSDVIKTYKSVIIVPQQHEDFMPQTYTV